MWEGLNVMLGTLRSSELDNVQVNYHNTWLHEHDLYSYVYMDQ